MTEFISRNHGHGYYEIHVQTNEEAHYKAAVEFARKLVDHAKPVTDNNVGGKWIPVTERLPNLYEDCFVLVKMKYEWEDDYEYHVDAGCYVGDNGYIGSFNTYNDWDEGQQYIQVTHWMPLPEPPKDGE